MVQAKKIIKRSAEDRNKRSWRYIIAKKYLHTLNEHPESYVKLKFIKQEDQWGYEILEKEAKKFGRNTTRQVN